MVRGLIKALSRYTFEEREFLLGLLKNIPMTTKIVLKPYDKESINIAKKLMAKPLIKLNGKYIVPVITLVPLDNNDIEITINGELIRMQRAIIEAGNILKDPDVCGLKTIQGILLMQLIKKSMTKDDSTVDISISDIRKVCYCENKYKQYSQLREKIIDIAEKDICLNSCYDIEYTLIKESRKIDKLRFFIKKKEY